MLQPAHFRSLGLAFALTTAIAACSSSTPEKTSLPTTQEAFGGQQCSAYRPPTEPDLMGWDPGSRANLNVLRTQGVVAVRYNAQGCNVELEVLSNCIGQAEQSYAYSPYSASDTKTARDSRELFAALPIGAARLGGKVRDGKALRTDVMLVGVASLPAGITYRRQDLKGTDCGRATHIVKSVYLGGFAMVAGASRSVEVAASVFGIGAGASGENALERIAKEGSPEACSKAQEIGKESPQCSVPLRIGLLALDTPPEEKSNAPLETKDTRTEKTTAKKPSQPSGINAKAGDRDGDGIPDNLDKCPDIPEDFDGFQDNDGCPDPDNDQDGILDVKDKCPNDPEDKDGFEDDDGCPDPDNDRDGILDINDKCPNIAGPPPDGCPKSTSSSGQYKGMQPKGSHLKTVPAGQVFKTASPTFAPGYEQLLAPIRDWMEDNKDSGVKLTVEVHSDNVGSESANTQLTQQRADAIVRWLLLSSKLTGRVTGKGYGPNKPINTNATSAGRDDNRRIEFLISP